MRLGSHPVPCPARLAALMRGMVRVQGHAVETAAGHEATVFLVLFETVVTRLAQALQRTEREGVNIAMMRDDVIDHRRGFDLPLLLTEPAERLERELIPA